MARPAWVYCFNKLQNPFLKERVFPSSKLAVARAE